VRGKKKGRCLPLYPRAPEATKKNHPPFHFTSRCRVWRFRYLLYFISSSRSGVFLRFCF
jgi:hypothetical protein